MAEFAHGRFAHAPSTDSGFEGRLSMTRLADADEASPRRVALRRPYPDSRLPARPEGGGRRRGFGTGRHGVAILVVQKLCGAGPVGSSAAQALSPILWEHGGIWSRKGFFHVPTWGCNARENRDFRNRALVERSRGTVSLTTSRGPSTSDVGREMERGDYWSALVRGWWLIVIVGLVGLAAGLVSPRHQVQTQYVSTSSIGSPPTGSSDSVRSLSPDQILYYAGTDTVLSAASKAAGLNWPAWVVRARLILLGPPSADGSSTGATSGQAGVIDVQIQAPTAADSLALNSAFDQALGRRGEFSCEGVTGGDRGADRGEAGRHRG